MKKIYIILIAVIVVISGYSVYMLISQSEDPSLYIEVSKTSSEISDTSNRREVGIEMYIVQEGDTLESVAEGYGITVKSIEDNNDISPDGIYPGHTLIIPPADGLVVVVLEGDTVSKLAEKYSVKASEIADANWLDIPYELEINSAIFIPGAVL